ncbi:MAG: prepilin-type N-terminal cleavage/methylation domain-containing protein [Phycisphaerales bacterium]
MKKKNGFTLVELLVVISIIALLLAVLMPALSKARDQGRRIVCLNLCKTFGTASSLYLNVYNNIYVPFSQEALNKQANEGDYGYWDERWPQNRYFRKCIAANSKVDEKKLEELGEGWEKPYIFPAELRCPAQLVRSPEEYCKPFYDKNGWRVVMSFAMNTERWTSQRYDDAVGWMPSDKKMRAYTAGKVKKPGAVAFFIESNYYQTRYYKANYETFWEKFGDKYLTPDNWAQVCYRHSEKADVLFFDGHAKSLLKTEIFNKSNRIRGFSADGNYRKPEQLWDAEYPLVGAVGNGI